LVLLATGVLTDQPVLLFGAMTVGALALASAWRWRFKQGPLEKLVAVPSTAIRKGVTLLLARNRHGAAPSRTSPTGRATRAGIQFLVPVACAGVLALAFWAGARSATPPVDGSTVLADAAVSDGSDESDVSGAEAQVPGAAAEPVPPAAVPPAGSAAAPPAGAAAPAGDARRYCELSDQLYALTDAHPDQPAVVAQKGATQLTQMPQVAPAEVRDAVIAIVAGYHAEAGTPGANAPDEATLTRAVTTVEAFEDRNC
jgi:hypothetical protein